MTEGSDSSSTRIEIRVLGGADVRGVAQGDRLPAQPKLMLVVTYLLLARPRGFQQRDRLLGLFWPEQSPDRARASLRNALTSIRDVLGEDVVLRRGDTQVAIDAARVWCDALAFDEAVAAGEYARALELYRGPLLPGAYSDAAPVEQWLDEERATLHGAAGDAAWKLAEQFEHGADMTTAGRWARKAAKLAGVDERRIRRVMSLLERAGDRAGAIAVYEDFNRFLGTQLDVQPSPETRALAEAIRAKG